MATHPAFGPPPHAVEWYPEGESALVAQPGDFLLVRHTSWGARAIRIGQGWRFRGELRQFNWCNHAALVYDVDANGTVWVIEEEGRGPSEVQLGDYQAQLYALVRPELSDEQRAAIRRFGLWLLSRNREYGWPTIVALALYCATGLRVQVGSADSMICSALVAWGEMFGGLLVDCQFTVMPCELARAYQAAPPVPMLRKGSEGGMDGKPVREGGYAA